MASKVRNLIPCLLCLLLFVGPSSSLRETLVQGQEVKDGDELVSAQGNFKLGFFTLESNSYYLGIWYNDNRQRQDNLVWVANRDTPIFNNSGSLTIDGSGNLKISHDGGLPIVLYSGQEGSNTSAVLLDTGNFVLRELNNSEELWQSFDYPSHILVPGMKLGVNRKTGHTWSLTSWRGEVVPDLGVFTFGMDSNHTNQLVIMWHDNIYWTSGCMPAQLPECRSPDDVFYSHFTFMYSDGFKFSESENLTLMDCEAKCLNNCSCVAYASTIEDAQTGCEIWTSTPARFNGSSNSNARTIYFLNSAIGKKKMKQNMLVQEFGHAMTSTDLKIFSFESITAATNNFSTENGLGMGGFGPVYKEKLVNEQEIAIKRLFRNSRQGLMELKNEVILITKLQHTNLVTLLGFCIQEEEKILIYEYMANKSLDFFLFDSTKRRYLNWEKRINIIEGIAQGLVYLHKYSRLKVIHCDLKASNILLNDEMNPKISDFGLAIKFETLSSFFISHFSGYMVPEYAMNGIISTKVDVFSFGVLLLEILTGKKNNNLYHSYHPLNLIGHAWRMWNEGRGIELIDTTLNESCSSNEALRCIQIGLLCVQENASDRPAM
ncbi:hypothetical protein ACB098_05G052200 [Castanea mollissima]